VVKDTPIVTNASEPHTLTRSSDDAPQVRFAIDQSDLRPHRQAPAEIKLRLYPKDLGTVRVTLRSIQNHLSARVAVQTEGARQAVESNLGQLQRVMVDAGIIVDRFEVTVNGTLQAMHTENEARDQHRRQAGKFKTNRRYRRAAGLDKTGAIGSTGSSSFGGPTIGGSNLNLMA